MKRVYCFCYLLSFFLPKIVAQQFIEKATIEFEVKTNLKKSLGNNIFSDMIKDNISTFKTGFYHYTFANNKSFYKLDHFATDGAPLPDWFKKDDEENAWYSDYSTGKYQALKNVVGSQINVSDSLPKIEWKLLNENLTIAGFNCRKAVGKIFDSVYVFVFYAEEIPISGGPCSISGLPGMILGMTIPRLFTSWIATKVNVVAVDESLIKPIAAKKTYTKKEFRDILMDKTKDWDSDADSKEQEQRFLWDKFL